MYILTRIKLMVLDSLWQIDFFLKSMVGGENNKASTHHPVPLKSPAVVDWWCHPRESLDELGDGDTARSQMMSMSHARRFHLIASNVFPPSSGCGSARWNDCPAFLYSLYVLKSKYNSRM